MDGLQQSHYVCVYYINYYICKSFKIGNLIINFIIDLHEKFILTIVANLTNAFIIIVFLYIRKLYLFSKISRKILKERRMNMEVTLQGEPFADSRQQYGGK